MKTKELKVGDSFEVVEVLDHNYSDNQFKVGGHTISLSICHQIANGQIDNDGWFEEYLGQKTLCLLSEHTKPIGKLTITKVK